MNPPDYFIPNRDPNTFYPLRDSRSVRAPSIFVAEKYIEALTAPGDLVVDTFGALPNVARAALNLGRRAIVVEQNPLWAWLSKSMAALASESEINTAFAKLGDALKDDAPLGVHVDNLYATTCAACKKSTPADYFIRTRDSGIVSRHYTCAHCGQTRDDPATEDDLNRAAAFDAHGLHYHVAFQRVAPADNSHGDRIHKMLDVYTPRNLYALVTLTQKIDALFREPRERNILLLLLLHILDRGTSFYSAPDISAQLKTHKQFVEFNVWREMEWAAKEFVTSALAGAARVSTEQSDRVISPIGAEISRRFAARNDNLELAESVADVLGSPSVEMFIGQGSAKGLGQRVPPQSVSLALTTLPSRRLSVWALSYLWGAWLLGRDSAQPLAAFLDVKKNIQWERRWYFDLLVQAFHGFAKMLKPDGHVVCVFDSAWHQVIEMLLLAAAGTGFSLDTFLFQPRLGAVAHSEFDDIHGDYRVTFSKNFNPIGVKPLKQIEKEIQQAALAAGSEILARRGEPLAYSWVHHAAYVRAMRAGLLAEIVKAKPKTPLGQIAHQAVKTGLSEGYAHDFDHYASARQAQFVWLRHSRELAPPLIDRVEDAVRALSFRGAERREISSGAEISRFARNDIEDIIYRQFPGDLTPEAGLIELCAAATPVDAAEKTRAMEMLAKMGERLGYQVSGVSGQGTEGKSKLDLVWESDGEIAHTFIWRDRAQFADLTQIHIAPARGYLVVPEALVELAKEKTRRLPHLADAFHEAGWNFVRVPFVEKLLNTETIETADWALTVGLTPPVLEDKTQLELL